MESTLLGILARASMSTCDGPGQFLMVRAKLETPWTDASDYYQNPEFHKPGRRHAGLPESAILFSHVPNRITLIQSEYLTWGCHGPRMVREGGISTIRMLART